MTPRAEGTPSVKRVALATFPAAAETAWNVACGRDAPFGAARHFPRNAVLANVYGDKEIASPHRRCKA